MTVSNISRNLRDGAISVNDGASATLTLTLENGDLNWEEPSDTVEVKDRGDLDHTRPGDQMSCPLSFSLIWKQLIANTVNSSDGEAFYEFVNNIGSSYSSTSAVGEQFTLEYVFTITDPSSGTNTETVTFAKVYKDRLNMNEDGDGNLINFSGVDYETKPTIARA